MSSVFQEPGVELAFHKYYNLAILTDGSIHRAPYNPPPLLPSPFPSSPDQVATEDVTLNHGHGTWARLFLPPRAGSNERKLPILLYFHGGGFLNSTTARPSYHGFLCKLAAHANALIVSVDYRLAPESPLPAAYEDCFEALLWLNNQAKLGNSSADPWLANHADFSRCFMGGDSAGANIAHHVAMKAAGFGAWGQGGGGQEQLGLGQNLKHIISVQGLILIHPFFSCGAATVGIVEANVWKYCGVSLDHPFADPLSSGAPSLVRAALPPMLVAIAGSDHLRDRGLAYHQGLVDAGKEAKMFVSENEIHVFHLQTPDSKNIPPFLDELRDFINLKQGNPQ